MTVKIITDSVADLPAQVVKELGITVIPLIICFGDEMYRDNVDMTAQQFYERLGKEKTLPSATVASPATFAETYDRLAEETDEILVITLTSKLSNAYETASLSKQLMTKTCRVEVLDSQQITMAQGFIVMAAARAAASEADFDNVMNAARSSIPRVEMRTTFDTLKYLRRGGRIGKLKALWGSILRIHPIVTLKDGVIRPAGRVRSREKAIDYLYDFAMSYSHIEEIAVECASAAEDAELLIERLGSGFPKERIYRSTASPVLGAHTGPNHLILSVMGDR